MMSADRAKMIAALKVHVVPILRQRGFSGSFPHFRRPTAACIHLLTFQFDRWGGGFVVEIAQCPPDGATMHSGRHIPPAKVNPQYLRNRLRLGSSAKEKDHWFRFDDQGPTPTAGVYDSVAQEVIPYLDGQAEDWWRNQQH
jgi:hypothetical protein